MDKLLCLAIEEMRGTETVEFLIQNGAKAKQSILNSTCKHGTPLHHAVHVRNVSAARTLIEYGADVDTVSNEFGSSPLDLAQSMMNNEEMVTLLTAKRTFIKTRSMKCIKIAGY